MLVSRRFLEKHVLWMSHVVGWLAYSFLLYTINSLKIPALTYSSILLLIVPLSFVFYSVLAILIFAYKTGKCARALVYLLCAYLGLPVFGYIYIYQLLPFLHIWLFRQEVSFLWSNYFWTVVPVLLHFSVYAAVYFFIRLASAWYKRYQSVNRFRQEAFYARKQQELLLLNSQIASHFIGNTLHNWYGRLSHTHTELAERFLKWSELVNYNLKYYADLETRLVPLEVELRQLEIMMDEYFQGKVWERVQVLQVSGDLGGLYVPPYTFITFFENMIKHGVLQDPNEPPCICLQTHKDGFTFRTVNRIANRKTNSVVHHIGLTNVQKRLRLLLKDNFELTYALSDNYFYLRLDLKA